MKSVIEDIICTLEEIVLKVDRVDLYWGETVHTIVARMKRAREKLQGVKYDEI